MKRYSYAILLFPLLNLFYCAKLSTEAQKHNIQYTISGVSLSDLVLAVTQQKLTNEKLTEVIEKGKSEPNSYSVCLEIASDNESIISDFFSKKDGFNIINSLKVASQTILRTNNLAVTSLDNSFTLTKSEVARNQSCFSIPTVKNNNCVVDPKKVSQDTSDIKTFKSITDNVILNLYADSTLYTLITTSYCK